MKHYCQGSWQASVLGFRWLRPRASLVTEARPGSCFGFRWLEPRASLVTEGRPRPGSPGFFLDLAARDDRDLLLPRLLAVVLGLAADAECFTLALLACGSLSPLPSPSWRSDCAARATAHTPRSRRARHQRAVRPCSRKQPWRSAAPGRWPRSSARRARSVSIAGKPRSLGAARNLPATPWPGNRARRRARGGVRRGERAGAHASGLHQRRPGRARLRQRRQASVRDRRMDARVPRRARSHLPVRRGATRRRATTASRRSTRTRSSACSISSSRRTCRDFGCGSRSS